MPHLEATKHKPPGGNVNEPTQIVRAWSQRDTIGQRIGHLGGIKFYKRHPLLPFITTLVKLRELHQEQWFYSLLTQLGAT